MTLDTKDPEYAHRLQGISAPLWKRILPVQAPYRWNLQRLRPGFTLDLGCGIGRNLKNLEGRGVGIDHSPEAVRLTRSQGFKAFLPEEFEKTEYAVGTRFDSILLAHVAEHLQRAQVIEFVSKYLELLKPGGKLILITPQERGFRSDSTHVEFQDFPALSEVVSTLGLRETRQYSFPFPRFMGEFFIYNEFISVSVKP